MKNIHNKYGIYYITYDDDQSAYYILSDFDAIVEKHINNKIHAISKIDFPDLYIADNSVSGYNNVEYHLYDVKLQKLNGIGVIAQNITEVLELLDLSDKFAIENIYDSGKIEYIKSTEEIEIETERMRIG